MIIERKAIALHILEPALVFQTEVLAHVPNRTVMTFYVGILLWLMRWTLPPVSRRRNAPN